MADRAINKVRCLETAGDQSTWSALLYINGEQYSLLYGDLTDLGKITFAAEGLVSLAKKLNVTDPVAFVSTVNSGECLPFAKRKRAKTNAVAFAKIEAFKRYIKERDAIDLSDDEARGRFSEAAANGLLKEIQYLSHLVDVRHEVAKEKLAQSAQLTAPPF